MKIFFLCFFCFAFLASSQLPAQSQAEMNAEAGTALEAADRELNEVYQKALTANAGDSSFCSDLKEAQRAWVRFVDFHLKTLFPLKDGENPRVVYGSIYPMEFCAARQTLIEARTQQLKSLLTDERESP